MTKHIGIVAGSAEGAALCYRTICLEAPAIMGEHNHPEITMNSIPMAEHMPPIRANDWEAVARLMAASAQKVASAGADFAICPDNTYHQAFKFLIPLSPIPWLHIAVAVAEEANRSGYTRLGILGTKYLTESNVYPEALAEFKIEREIPDQAVKAAQLPDDIVQLALPIVYSIDFINARLRSAVNVMGDMQVAILLDAGTELPD